MTTRQDGPLTLAARAFEDELSRYEEVASETTKAPITSEKSLLRAKKQLGEAAECQTRLAARLDAVVVALEGSRTRQEACMGQVVSAATRVQGRAEELLALMERFSAVGLRARDVNEPVAAVVARKSAGAPRTELLEGLRDVLAKTDAVVLDAEALARDAASAEWADIARAADSLRQQILSARNQVLLAEKMMAEPSPS